MARRRLEVTLTPNGEAMSVHIVSVDGKKRRTVVNTTTTFDAETKYEIALDLEVEVQVRPPGDVSAVSATPKK